MIYEGNAAMDLNKKWKILPIRKSTCVYCVYQSVSFTIHNYRKCTSRNQDNWIGSYTFIGVEVRRKKFSW